ncbi:hypothetical protein AVEN_68780-1 [Araneus ventricosus]|uniref:DUF4817 domain-containing protein n=1 Tax=Araneus ventricosus TaxID=182803 RepID=A0A4Y2C849_ARAVE|nr:hypothetical protein AVEN_68780-1 [Araneus ventricosus]
MGRGSVEVDLSVDGGSVAFVTETVVTRLEFGDGEGARSLLSEDGVGLKGWRPRCACSCASVWVVTFATIGVLRMLNSTMSGIEITWISCIMQMRMERHICSPETTAMKRMFLLGCTLNLRVMAKLGINERCEMLIIYSECGLKAKSAERLYRECFPEGPHPTRQTILNVVKRLREMGCVTSRPRVHRPRNVRRKVQSQDVLEYALAHPQSSTKMISENCGLSKSSVWTILNESGAQPYRYTPVQRLLPRDAERRYTWCNFQMN